MIKTVDDVYQSGHCNYCQHGFENHEYTCTGGCRAAFPMRIIGLCGYAGSGKSEAAKYLSRRWHMTRLRFAEALKEMMAVLGLSEEEIEGDLKEKPCDILCGRSPRYAMQTIGTEWGRDLIGSDLWVNVWKRKAQAELERRFSTHYGNPKQNYSTALIVVEDVRFLNEAKAIRDMGGIIIRIDRENRSRNAGNHASEKLIRKVDYALSNKSSLSDFHKQLDCLMDGLRKNRE